MCVQAIALVTFLQLYVPLQFENRVYPLEIERDTGMMMVKMKGLMTRLAHRPRLIGRLD